MRKVLLCLWITFFMAAACGTVERSGDDKTSTVQPVTTVATDEESEEPSDDAADDAVCAELVGKTIRFVSEDPEMCARVRFACEPGETMYGGECGCGCIVGEEPVEEFCYELYQPVCGVDGKTYSNDCFARMAGIQIAHAGECGAEPEPEPEPQPEPEPDARNCGGIAGEACPAGQYCNLAAGDGCVPDAMGVCAPVPEACTMQYDPVCGCDGVTYGNACGAAAAGASVASRGECQ